MSMRRARLSDFIDSRGRSVLILRDAGNIPEVYAIAQMNPNVKGSSSMLLDSYQESFFRWDSQLCSGDIFQDQISMERHILLSLQKIGVDGQHDGFKVSSCRSNDGLVLYRLIQGTPDPQYGRSSYTLLVKVNDYCHVSHWARGDSLTPIGDMERGQIFILFSGRKLSGYVPRPGDCCQLGSGTGDKFQIDGIDDHVFPGCYRVLCSPDKRL